MSEIKKSKIELIYCGLLSGVLQSGVFNFWDRALFLSLKENRNFLDKRNFIRPMEGVLQSLAQRAISGGLYFPLEDIYRFYIQSSGIYSLHFQNVLSGVLAGGTNGLIMNPASIIKYHMWGSDDTNQKTFIQTMKSMYQIGKFKIFLVGGLATLTRDIVFGGIYAFLRQTIYSQYIHNIVNNNNNINNINNSDNNLESDLREIFCYNNNNINYAPRKYGEEPLYIGDYQRLAPNTKIYNNIMRIKEKIVKKPV